MFADNIEKLLPTASRIGFTGTPLLSSNEITARTFGGYISVYDFKRAVEDKATVPLYYENRGDKIKEIKNPDITDKILDAIEEADLKALSESWQSYLNDMESDMMIVRVAKDAPSVYSIFYDSDKRFADGNRYPDFLETLKFVHPHYRINLRHIRDVDGHFVTTDEYLTRPRN